MVFGIPADLADPEHYTPTPWETYTYDANDNAGRTHGDATAAYSAHWNTPASIVVDALGRTVTAIARNGPDPAKVSPLYTPRSMHGAFHVTLDGPARVRAFHLALCGSRRTGECPGGLVVLEHPRKQG